MLLRLLRTHLRPYTGLLVCVLVLQFAQVMASLYLPTLNADIIDKGVATGDSGYIWRMGAFMLGVSLAQGVCSVAATYLAARAAMSMGRDLRGEVFDRVSGFSEREISAFGAGSLITRNTNDVQQVQMLVMMSATMLVTAPVMAVGGIVMAVTRAPGLSWLIGLSVPVLLVAVGLIVGRMLPLFRSYQDKLDAINRVMREQLTGIRIDHFIVADFESFKTLTDEIGGVTINLKTPQTLAGTELDAGAQLLNGEQALAYTRERRTLPGGDFDRINRQQAWMRAIVFQVFNGDTLSDPTKLYSFLHAVTSTMAVDEGLTVDEMQDLALGMRDVRSKYIKFMTVPTAGTDMSHDGQSIVNLDPDADALLFEAFATDAVEEYMESHPGAVELLPATVN